MSEGRKNSGTTPDERLDAPEDDRIIGVAFRLSMIALLLMVIVAGSLAWWLQRSPAELAVEEVALSGPEMTRRDARSAPPPVRFTDVTEAAGIDFVHENGAYGERMLPETMGSGVAVLDYDNDGYQDLLFVNAASWPWRPEQSGATQALYRNLGNGRFEDVTRRAGLDKRFYGVGAAVGDYDGDGNTDIFITAVGANRLFRNSGAGTFEEQPSAGVAGEGETWSSSAAFVDYDRDGDLDLFVCNYVRWSRDIDLEVDYRLTGVGRAYGPPGNYEGTDNYLYRNEGGGRFTDVSASAGIRVSNPATGRPVGKGLAVVPADLDGDGWTDLVVANDTVRNFYFRNSGQGGFEEIGSSAGIAFDNQGSATGAMGIDAALINEEGDLAVAIGNFANEMTSFYVARSGSGLFTDEAIVTGIGPDSRQALSFGLFFFDYDLDGRLDMLQTNGHVENEINTVQPSQNYAQPTQLFWNCGTGCAREFVKVADAGAGDLSRPLVGRAAAYLDYDGDGDLDVIITQVARRPVLLRNDQALEHHWVRLKLRGRSPNTGALGAMVELSANGRRQLRVVNPSRSYLSQVELPVTFGLGEGSQIDSLRVIWPDGESETVDVPGVDQMIVVEQP